MGDKDIVVGFRIQACRFCGKLFGVGAMDHYAIPKHDCTPPTKEWAREMRRLKRLFKQVMEQKNKKSRSRV